MDPPDITFALGEARRACAPTGRVQDPFAYSSPCQGRLKLELCRVRAVKASERGQAPTSLLMLAPAAWAQIYLDRNNQPN